MIKHFLIAASMFASIATYAQQTEMRKVSGFKKLEIGGSFDAIIQQGSEPSVKISYQNIDPNKIITKNDGDVLKVYLENGNYREIKVKVYITYTSLNSLARSGSGNLTCKSDLSSSSSFDLNSSGSGNISIEGKLTASGEVVINRSGSGNMSLEGLQASTIKMDFSGSGDFEVNSGNAKSQIIHLNGSGNVSAYGLKTETCDVSVAGSGDIAVYVTNSISARITGSGNIDYKGEGSVKEIEVHGSGRINKKS